MKNRINHCNNYKNNKNNKKKDKEKGKKDKTNEHQHHHHHHHFQLLPTSPLQEKVPPLSSSPITLFTHFMSNDSVHLLE